MEAKSRLGMRWELSQRELEGEVFPTWQEVDEERNDNYARRTQAGHPYAESAPLLRDVSG